MGYNISDVSGNLSGGLSEWSFTADLSDPSVTTVTGDFDVVNVLGGNAGEATDGYSFSALSTDEYGSLAFDETDGTFTFSINRAAVFQSGSNQVVEFTITGTSGADSDDDLITINLLICVARGTMIDTDHGRKPVEDLRVGDLVATKDGSLRPLRWLASRKLSSSDLAADPSLQPIRIAADTFGPGLPLRDLVVSPQHRVLVSDWRAEFLFGAPDVLAPAKALVNEISITVDTTLAPVEYFHMLFDEHEVVFTEGLPTESLNPGLYSFQELGDAACVELRRLFPDFFEKDVMMKTAYPCLKPWEARIMCCAAE
jgi:hypothetical protein